MKLRTPNHATVVAYLALIAAIGGSAYAVSKIGSAEIQNRSIQGKDVADNALGGRQVKESNLTGPAAVGNAAAFSCDPAPGAPTDCAGANLSLKHSDAVLVITTGTSNGGSGDCAIVVDNTPSNAVPVTPTVKVISITDVTSTLGRGTHSFALRCTEGSSNLVIEDATLAAVAVTRADLGSPPP